MMRIVRRATVVASLAVIVGCGGGGGAKPARPPADPPAKLASMDLSTVDPADFTAELWRVAHTGDDKTLDSLVDWDFVKRLAVLSGGSADPGALSATLRAVPKTCAALEWRVDEGGFRLDFPPAMVDDPPAEQAENDAIHKELYQGHDVTAVCDGETLMVVQVLRDAGGVWHVRGWGRIVEGR